MENLNDSDRKFVNVPGDIDYIPQRSREKIEYIPQRSREQNMRTGEKALGAMNGNETEKKAEQRIKAKHVLIGVAATALVIGGLIVAKDGAEHQPMTQDKYEAMANRAGASVDVDYAEEYSSLSFSRDGVHYFLEDEGSNGTFEKGHSIKDGGEASADFELTDVGLSVEGAVGELNTRMR